MDERIPPGVNVFTAGWALAAGIAVWYMTLNLRRFWQTKNRLAGLSDEHGPEKFWSRTRYQRYFMVYAVNWMLIGLGVVVALVPRPILPEVDALVRVVIPVLFGLVHGGLAHWSKREHTDYHDGVAVVFHQSLALEAARRKVTILEGRLARLGAAPTEESP